MVLKLKTEQEIKATWVEGDEVVVSILCMTFNHELYIQEAINGFLMLAVGAMPISTTAKHVMGFSALGAFVNRHSKMRSSAIHNCFDHFSMIFRHSISEFFQYNPVRIPQQCHVRSPYSNPFMRLLTISVLISIPF